MISVTEPPSLDGECSHRCDPALWIKPFNLTNENGHWPWAPNRHGNVEFTPNAHLSPDLLWISFKIILCSKHLRPQMSNMALGSIIFLLLIKEVHLHGDVIKHQEHHSTDIFGNPATQGAKLKQHLSSKCWAPLGITKLKTPVRDGNNGKSTSTKLETKLGFRRKLGFVPLQLRQQVEYSCWRAR